MNKKSIFFMAACMALLSAAVPGRAAQENTIAAVPLTDNRLLVPGASLMSISLEPDSGRLLVKVSVCRPASDAAPRRIQSCQNIRFALNGLRYNGADKAFLLGDTPVARDRGFWRGGWRFESGFTPEPAIVETNCGDNCARKSLTLALVRN
jgi:hypothetical protein